VTPIVLAFDSSGGVTGQHLEERRDVAVSVAEPTQLMGVRAAMSGVVAIPMA
jgi:hypothetical protein